MEPATQNGSFRYINSPSDERCGICMESMSNTVALKHEGENGGRHASLHAECIRDWILRSGITACSFCGAQTDISSLFTWDERVCIELTQIKNDVLLGADRGEGLVPVMAMGAMFSVINGLFKRRGLPHF